MPSTMSINAGIQRSLAGQAQSRGQVAGWQALGARDQYWRDKDLWKQQQQDRAANKRAGEQLGGGLSSLVNNYNTAYGQAKEANEARYQQMLGIADQTTGQRMADVRSDYGNQQSNAMQQLARLGMGNTTVAPTMNMGIEREKQASLNRTADEMQGTKLGIIERRSDNYPDLSSLQSIISGAGSYFGQQGLPAMLQAFGNIRSY